MANAKKLTEQQVAALSAAAKGELFYHRRNHPQRTIDALRRRGLVGNYVRGSYELLPAGRQALFETTGSWGAQETPYVPPPKEEP